MFDIQKARDIVRCEEEAAGITPEEPRDPPRTLRHRILERLREETELTYREIALMFGY